MHDDSDDFLTEYQNYVFDFSFSFNTYLEVSSATEMEMQSA
jgi:hypothetical protein